MTTQDNLAVAAAASVDGGRWLAHLDDLMTRIAGRFSRVEPRRRARQLVLGLLSDLPRKNCWTIAEHVGDRSPDGLQHLLTEARWDHDGVRDDLRDYVVAGHGAENAVLVVDETGDLKKGSHTVGVQRQYTGTAGRVENAQVAVYLTYATDAGHAFIDRKLYLPRCWADDPDRRAAAGVPDEVEFATKPTLARQMITRALGAGVGAGWVSGDEVYGADPGLRRELETRGVSGMCSRSDPTAGWPPAPASCASTRPPAPCHARPGPPIGRQRRQGPTPVSLGPGRHRRRPARAPVAARPTQPHHR